MKKNDKPLKLNKDLTEEEWDSAFSLATERFKATLESRKKSIIGRPDEITPDFDIITRVWLQ